MRFKHLTVWFALGAYAYGSTPSAVSEIERPNPVCIRILPYQLPELIDDAAVPSLALDTVAGAAAAGSTSSGASGGGDGGGDAAGTASRGGAAPYLDEHGLG